ncbi:purine/pyrimidine permease [Aquabacter sp. L1I39]|uniref:solute carrier family 23 protein n=1 Tax=Aquabacter sp. L1I39 TaxID=2820278 RepID=UPI001ADC8123|nr:solute carrier family 23 protein [Aquabacter sp. L1I39]QTL05103.1 purine/pyrimidine permease [Aquabacter sp. L1I39]
MEQQTGAAHLGHVRRIARGVRRWLAPPRGSARPTRRPSTLVYGLDDKVPLSTLVPLSVQHAMLALTFLIYPLVAASEAHLGAHEMQAVMTACTMSMGLATILQSARTRIGSGYLGVHIPSPSGLPLAVQALTLGGPPLMAATTLMVGVCQVFMARLARPMRILAPPEVCGVAVLMLGMSLAGPALRRALGLEGGAALVRPGALTVSMATLALIVGITVFAPRRFKLFAVVTGATLGWLLAVPFGVLQPDMAKTLAEVEFVDLPALALPGLTLAPSLFPLLALVVMMSFMDVLSTTVSLEKMNDADWRRADMGAAGRAISTVGLGNILNGLTTGFQCGLSSSAVGLAFATGATARIIGICAGVVIFATAFFPKAIVALTLIPSPVIGGILLYTSAYLLVAGMDLILSRRLSERRVFLVGLSILAGMSVALLPLKEQLHPAIQPLFSNPLTVAICAAMLLNLIMRIGISKESALQVEEGANAFLTVRTFLEQQGDMWGARRDVIAAAIPVAAQALEVVVDNGIAEGPVELRARFDETHLDVFVIYDGAVLEVPKERPSPEALLGDAQEVARFAAYLLKGLGDKVTFGRVGGKARIILRFDH